MCSGCVSVCVTQLFPAIHPPSLTSEVANEVSKLGERPDYIHIAELGLSILAPTFKRIDDIRNCSSYRVVELLEHGMKVVERELLKRLHRIVTDDEMQFGSMPERGTFDAVFITRRLREEYHAKGKSNMCLVDLEKAFDRAPRKVLDWAMRKKEVHGVLVR